MTDRATVLTSAEKAGAAAFYLPIAIAGVIWRGWVFTVLWGWFVVPLFGLPALGLSQAIGLMLVINYLTFHKPQPDERSLIEQIFYGAAWVALYPAMVLLVGWIVQGFLP